MSLTSGTRLGPYEVVNLLGAGGMGEVYRARDTRLDRTVALKVLSKKISTNTSARERFEREARAISALNHPNICTLFDVGTHEGTEYLVMELIDGESLADRLIKGAMPPELVTRIGASIAEALARAHRSGIIHRDLKPGNIILTKGGPKLLDFGLARTASQELTTHDATTAIEKALTADGMILGTLPYMSPEQLEGKPADARTDIFALGAVLYEMVTGRRAFNASSQASLISKIMTEHPVPIPQLQPIAPPALHRLITRCLAKDPDDRWQCAADVAAELRWIEESGEQAVAVAKRSRPIAAWAIATVATIVAMVLGLSLMRRPAPSTRALRFNIAPPPRATFLMGGGATSLSVSPDGTKIAFTLRDASNARQIWVYDLTRGTSKPIEVPNGSSSPFWSPDSRSIAFTAATKLKRLSIDEGTPQTICDVSSGGINASWMPDGTILYSQDFKSGGIMAVPAAGGTPKKVVQIAGAVDTVGPRAIGISHRFFFTVVEPRDTSIWIGDLDGAEKPRKLISGGRPVYDPPFLTFVREGTLFAQRFDESKMELTGPAAPIADGVWFFATTGLSHHAAAGGTLVWASSKQLTSLIWIDRSGRVLGDALPPGAYVQGRISPDGKRFATTVVDPRTLVGDIWIADLARKSLTRMTFGDHDHGRPIWSPDGRALAFVANNDGPAAIFTQQLGSNEEKLLTKLGQRTDDWLRDGRMLFNSDQPKTGSDIYITRADGSAEPWLQTPAFEAVARISPDQKWVAYISDDSGRFEVYAEALDRHADRVRVSVNGGGQPHWSRDGAGLYFVSGGDLFFAAATATADSIDFAPPVHVYSADQDIYSVDSAPDGRLMLAVRQIAPATQPLNVMSGWKEEAERLLANRR